MYFLGMKLKKLSILEQNSIVTVKVDTKNKTSLRFVTHTDITLEDVKLTIEKLKYVIDSEFKIPKDKQQVSQTYNEKSFQSSNFLVFQFCST